MIIKNKPEHNQYPVYNKHKHLKFHEALDNVSLLAKSDQFLIIIK